VSYFAHILEVETELLQGKCDPLKDPFLLENELDLAFICGLPFIQHYQMFPEQLQLWTPHLNRLIQTKLFERDYHQFHAIA
jgi:hypothetical protein